MHANEPREAALQLISKHDRKGDNFKIAGHPENTPLLSCDISGHRIMEFQACQKNKLPNPACF